MIRPLSPQLPFCLAALAQPALAAGTEPEPSACRSARHVLDHEPRRRLGNDGAGQWNDGRRSRSLGPGRGMMGRGGYGPNGQMMGSGPGRLWSGMGYDGHGPYGDPHGPRFGQVRRGPFRRSPTGRRASCTKCSSLPSTTRMRPCLSTTTPAGCPKTRSSRSARSATFSPNATGTLDVNLTPGSYLLICNVPGHYAAGMVAELTVAP